MEAPRRLQLPPLAFAEEDRLFGEVEERLAQVKAEGAHLGPMFYGLRPQEQPEPAPVSRQVRRRLQALAGKRLA